MFEWAKKVVGGASQLGASNGKSGIGLIGLVQDTHVVTNGGWKPVEALEVGDLVLTFDNGLQPVADLHRENFQPASGQPTADRSPILLPAGALRNRRPLWLMPDQGLLIESEIAMEDIGDPFAIVPAKALAGHRGIASATADGALEVTKIMFEGEEAIYVEGGMLAHCPAPGAPFREGDDIQLVYNFVGFRTAKFMVACQMDGAEPEGLTYGPEELAGIMAGLQGRQAR